MKSQKNSPVTSTLGTSFIHEYIASKGKSLGFRNYLILIEIFQATVTTTDNGLQWIVDSYFPPPPDGAIPDDDDNTTPTTKYYSRSAPTWNEVYESTTIVVYCE